MDASVLAAKSLMAVMLLIAGGAKLADRASFSEAVRLFVPTRVSAAVVRWTAVSVALWELLLGAGSLALPRIHWLNVIVFMLALGFVVVSVVGYLFHRGRSCRCFGALSRRKFDASSLLRSVCVAVLAAIAMYPVSHSSVDVAPSGSVLLLLAGTLVSVAAFSAARSLSIGRRYGLVMR